MTKEQCRHLIIERYPRDGDDYQCQQCLEPFVVRLADEPAPLTNEQATELLNRIRTVKPAACTCKYESTPTTMSVTTNPECPEHGVPFPDFGHRLRTK